MPDPSSTACLDRDLLRRIWRILQPVVAVIALAWACILVTVVLLLLFCGPPVPATGRFVFWLLVGLSPFALVQLLRVGLGRHGGSDV